MMLRLPLVALLASPGSEVLTVAVTGDTDLGVEVATVRSRVQQV